MMQRGSFYSEDPQSVWEREGVTHTHKLREELKYCRIGWTSKQYLDVNSIYGTADGVQGGDVSH